MSHEETAIIDEAHAFLAELFGRGIPLRNLMRDGALPAEWAARYLAFVERVSAHYGESSPLPREVLAVIYYASVYCTKRYFDWQRHTNTANEKTEAIVNAIRWAGDRLVLGPYWHNDGHQVAEH